MAGPAGSRRRWILAPIETKARELDAKTLLALAAAERGWGTILGPSRTLSAICGAAGSRVPRGVFIGTGIGPGHVDAYRAIRQAGSRVVSSCEEGLIYGDAEEYGRLKVEKASYDLLDAFFAWGPNQLQDVVSLGCDGGKVVVSGNPRFDLLRPELRGAFGARVERLRASYGPFILVNTKFNKYNHYFGEDFYLKRLRGQALLPTSATQAHEAGHVDYQRATMRAFMEAVGELSRRSPDHRIVVRPHPSENHLPWRQLAASLRNVEALFAGNVVDWILAAEATIHNNCTTGVEAYLAGRPAIAYRPLRNARYDMHLPHALSREATDVEALCTLVRDCLEGGSLLTDDGEAARRAVARQYIAGLDGAMSCDSIIEALDALDVPQAPLPEVFRAEADIEAASRALPAIEHRWEEARIGRYESYVEQKCGGLTADELLAFHTALCQVTDRFAHVEVVALRDNLLCVC